MQQSEGPFAHSVQLHPLIIIVLVLYTLGLGGACAPMIIRNQLVPSRALVPSPEDFSGVDEGRNVVLHYYGVGGWGIAWRDSYVMTAPYFSNHPLSRMSDGSRIHPDEAAIHAGLAGTPVGKTTVLLVGHGHVDHAADIRHYVPRGLIGSPVLVADRSVVNTFNYLWAGSNSYGPFRCVAPLDARESVQPITQCPTGSVRITALHSGHAPHYGTPAVNLTQFGGVVSEPRKEEPRHTGDFKVGYVWAYLIDLLDAQGRIAFRIHYMDAAAAAPHGFLPAGVGGQRSVDVGILTVPGFHLVDGYPFEIVKHNRVRHVMAAHWENFFVPRASRLRPVYSLSSRNIEAFLALAESGMGTFGHPGAPSAFGATKPENKDADRCKKTKSCGPNTASWTLPVPGETFRFPASYEGSR